MTERIKVLQLKNYVKIRSIVKRRGINYAANQEQCFDIL